MLNDVLENLLIERVTRTFDRSPRQRNQLHETDAEIIQLADDDRLTLAVTTDSVSEEVALGLYSNPYLIGWMSVMANMSDLAAVGAQPLGVLVAEVFGKDMSEQSREELQRGIADACRAAGTFVLGGDTNDGPGTVITGCAVGTVEKGRFNSRIGCRPGDVLYSTGKLGRGNGFALSQLARDFGERVDFLPEARLREGNSITTLATACMDTSDGVISTLDQLMRLNGVGFEISAGWEDVLDAASRQIAERVGISPWLLLAGQHGEFELLFTVPAGLEESLERLAGTKGWCPVRIGTVIPETAIRLQIHGRMCDIDTAAIRNLAIEYGSDVQGYVENLVRYDSLV